MMMDDREQVMVGYRVERRYEILKHLGEGGVGAVYLAADLKRRSRVAIKVMNDPFSGRQDRQRRFAEEAGISAAAGRLPQHANIATTFDSGVDPEVGPYIVMEYVEGPTLVGWTMQDEAVEPSDIYGAALGLAQAIAALHSAGVVHRDVNPGNVLVATDDGIAVPKLIDMSHAASIRGPRLLRGAPGRLTAPHEIPGTPGYMAPEQAQGANAMPSMDVFSFGVTLWELLAGKVAFRERDRGPYCAMQTASPRGPAPLSTVRSGLPAAVYQLVDDCTRVDPQQRPTAAEVVGRLGALVGQPAAVAPRRRPWLLTAGITLALLLITMVFIGFAFRLWRDDAAATTGDTDDAAVEPAAAVEPPQASTAGASAGIPSEPEPQPDPPPERPPQHPEPEPQPEPPLEADPQPEPPRPPKQHTAVKGPDCDEQAQEARAAWRQRAWKRVLRLTKARRCQRSHPEVIPLRAEALRETGQLQECVKLGNVSKHPQVAHNAATCRAMLERKKQQ